MEISKFRLTPETRERIATPMNAKKRKKLQYEHVKDFIRSKPSGTRISIAELAQSAGITNPSSQHYFITGMLESGIIQRLKDPHAKRSYSWTVTEDVKKHNFEIFDAATEFKKQAIKIESTPTSENHFFTPTLVQRKSEAIETLAREYVWQANNDSLRQFIEWLKQQ